MEEEYKPEDYQGRTKEQVERTYTGMRILAAFTGILIIILLTYLILKFITK